jgi:hypothetical protein
MPTAIIAGIPPESLRRVRSALKRPDVLPAVWQVLWMPSKGPIPGLAPSQLEEVRQTASGHAGAHLLIFRGREKHEEDLVFREIAPYFRLRWIDQLLLKLIPHSIDELFQTINAVLTEELEWIDLVKPRDESSCLLLPECAFSAVTGVRHLWTAATEPGIERIRLAARAKDRFAAIHWRNNGGARNWTDSDGRVFDYRGARHGVAPFPRPWKFSYRVVDGFHYDVMSKDGRAFHLTGQSGSRHMGLANGHINIDPHGYVRA